MMILLKEVTSKKAVYTSVIDSSSHLQISDVDMTEAEEATKMMIK